MFNNIIYFIIVLIIFNLSYPDNTQQNSLGYTMVMLSVSWLIFAGYCRYGFQRLLNRYHRDENESGGLSGQYQGLVFRLSVLAIFLFALDVYMFHLKYWLQIIPGVKEFSVLQGVLALMLFFFYLGTIWYFSHSASTVATRVRIPRRSFIVSNFKLNMPILFPWLILSLVYDLLSLSPWAGHESFMSKPEGQIIFFASFLIMLMIFMPRFIQSWWGCRAFEPSEKVKELKLFLHKKGFRYRELLRWPIFEGHVKTAGIMGIVPRYRYILVTDALMQILSVEELKAVLAHEMGHAKYRHLLFYILFFLGYMALSFGLFDLFFYLFATQPFFTRLLESGDPQAINLFHLALSLPILISLFVYFRYVMGYFMRNFERQADLYSAVTMESPKPAISSLEKIALLSGKIRELPSWHHFSIKQRVDVLWRFFEDPGLVRRHNRLVAVSFSVYLICMIGLGYFLNFSSMKENLTFHLLSKALDQQLTKTPNDIQLYQNLAMVYHRLGKYSEAIGAYERIIQLDPSQAVALNNLAWLLVTIPDEILRDKQRALVLAKKAVALERSPVFLDTLAEAYYANGLVPEAIRSIKEAISLATDGGEYYEAQLEKFRAKFEYR
jgi:Zn-dependent protease with chaperone function